MYYPHYPRLEALTFLTSMTVGNVFFLFVGNGLFFF